MFVSLGVIVEVRSHRARRVHACDSSLVVHPAVDREDLPELLRLHGVVKISLTHVVAALPRGGQTRGVHHVRDDRPGEPVHLRGEIDEVDVVVQRLIPDVYFQNLQPSLSRRRLHRDLSIEPSSAHQRLVQNVHPVRRRDAHHPGIAAEAVELDEELVQRLIPLVVPGPARAARTTDGVELVDENYGRRLLLRLREQVADARGADADEHLDKLRRGQREERRAGLARDRAREERLPAPGRARQHDAFRDLRARLFELFRHPEKVDNLRQLDLRVADARDVAEHDDVALVSHLHLRPQLPLLRDFLRRAAGVFLRLPRGVVLRLGLRRGVQRRADGVLSAPLLALS
eukprot:29952-Pelagococcus_subviridis.AAC.16